MRLSLPLGVWVPSGVMCDVSMALDTTGYQLQWQSQEEYQSVKNCYSFLVRLLSAEGLGHQNIEHMPFI